MTDPQAIAASSDNRDRLRALLRSRLGPRAGWSPLSFGQEALWFLWKFAPQSGAYNMVFAAWIEGSLDVPAFERCWERLGTRHAMLGARFAEIDGSPRQQAIPDFKLQIEILQPGPLTDAEFDALLYRESHRGFDLEVSAAPRVQILRRPAHPDVLLIVIHHIVGDLTSLVVTFEELRDLYAAELSGVPAALPPLPVTFEDYVLYQRKFLTPGPANPDWQYWLNELAPAEHPDLPTLDLPTDRPRPAERSFRGSSITHVIDAALLARVKRLAADNNVTLFMALLTAYNILLHRYTGQTELFVGTPTSGRTREEFSETVGDFVNMVPLCSTLAGIPSFRTLLHETRARVANAVRHQDYPFSLMVSGLHLPPDVSRSPIFQTSFALQKLHRFPELSRAILPGPGEPPIAFARMNLHPIPVAQQDGQYDLNVECKEDDFGALVLAWKFSTDLFDRSTVVRIAGHFETLLHALVDAPGRSVAGLPLLSPQESADALSQSAGALLPLPAATVAGLFEAQAARTPESIAITCRSQSFTYAQLAAEAAAVALRLRALGIGPETLVPIVLPRGISFIIALLAVSKAGAAFLPLDPRHPFGRVAALVDTPAILTEREHTGIDHRAIALEQLPAPAGQALPPSHPNHLAYVMLTSGSTGEPKRVMVEHRGMVNHCLAKLRDLGITAADRVAQTGPQSFDIVVWQCLAPLTVGAEVVVLPDEIAEDPAELLAALDRLRITVLQVVPSMLSALLDQAESGAGGKPPLRALRWIVPTGDALPTALCRRWFALYPHIPILNTYGSTECSDDQCHYALHFLDPSDDAVTVASIGTPIANISAYVLDDNLAPLPSGIVGELFIGGLGVGRGYLANPGQTAASFVPDPFSGSPGARLYRTGDRVRRRPDGRIDFLGRTDHMIKLRGFRIEPREIEAALCRHPAVSQAAALLRPDPAGEPRLVAYFVAPATPGDLRPFLHSRLPYYMVPALLHRLDALPFNASGKLDRKRLPNPDWETQIPEEFVAPRTPAEHTLAGVWSEVLNLTRVGVTQDFFAIGGDSIRSIQVIARARAAGLHLQPADLFRHRTIAALAAHLGQAAPAPSAPAPLPELAVSPEHLAVALRQIDFDQEEA